MRSRQRRSAGGGAGVFARRRLGGGIHRSLKIAQNVMEYSSGIATRAAACWKARARPIPMCSWPLPASISLGPNGFRLRRRKLAEPSRIGSGFGFPAGFDQHRVFTGGSTDSPPGCPSTARRFRNRSWVRKVATPEEALLLARAGIDSIQCERFTCADLEETVRGVKAVNAAVQVLRRRRRDR